jgi:CRP-like cAMP-binding protein
MVPTAYSADLWLQKLSRFAQLGDAELASLAALPFDIEDVANNRYLVREGDEVSRCCVLVQGYAARHKMARSGRRQIVSFHMPGDMLDLQHSLLPRADHNVQAMTPARVAWVPVAALARVISSYPSIAAAVAKEALVDASIFREWVLNVGARDAKTRIAHMLCEFVERRQKIGISPSDLVEVPFSQEQIADATGLTAVHVNRMLRELTDEGAFARNGRSLRISDWCKLKDVADFDPAYLHQAA